MLANNEKLTVPDSLGGEPVLRRAGRPVEHDPVPGASIADAWRAGDVFAAEFRAEQDESAPETYDKHYRRFQDGPTFRLALAERHEFDVIHVYRVIARRTASRNQP